MSEDKNKEPEIGTQEWVEMVSPIIKEELEKAKAAVEVRIGRPIGILVNTCNWRLNLDDPPRYSTVLSMLGGDELTGDDKIACAALQLGTFAINASSKMGTATERNMLKAKIVNVLAQTGLFTAEKTIMGPGDPGFGPPGNNSPFGGRGGPKIVR
jgi:hypothetical protein